MVLYPNKLPESERVCFGICSLYIKCLKWVIPACKMVKWCFIFRKGTKKAVTNFVTAFLGGPARA